MILYADILFAINFSMDFLSLFLCSIFLHLRLRKLNVILSALIGSLYAILQMLIELDGLLLMVVSALIAIIMVAIAFPQKKKYHIILQAAVYLFVSFVLGGIMSFFYSLLNSMLASFIASYSYENAYNTARIWIIISLTAIVSLVFSRILTSKKEEITAEITVNIQGNSFSLIGLADSGNLLKDPLSGRSVILVSEESEIGKRILKIQDIHKKFIPYHSVSGEGILKGVVPNEIRVNEVQVSAIVAPTKNKNFNNYDALVPRSLI